jgi:hypothetical protein
MVIFLFWFSTGRVLKKSRQLVETIRRKRRSEIQVPETQLTFIRLHNKPLTLACSPSS